MHVLPGYHVVLMSEGWSRTCRGETRPPLDTGWGCGRGSMGSCTIWDLRRKQRKPSTLDLIKIEWSRNETLTRPIVTVELAAPWAVTSHGATRPTWSHGTIRATKPTTNRTRQIKTVRDITGEDGERTTPVEDTLCGTWALISGPQLLQTSSLWLQKETDDEWHHQNQNRAWHQMLHSAATKTKCACEVGEGSCNKKSSLFVFLWKTIYATRERN